MVLSTALEDQLKRFVKNVNNGSYNEEAGWDVSSASLIKSRAFFDKLLAKGTRVKVPYEILPGAMVLTGEKKRILELFKKPIAYFPAFMINCESNRVKTIAIWMTTTIGTQGKLVPTGSLFYGYIEPMRTYHAPESPENLKRVANFKEIQKGLKVIVRQFANFL